MRRYLLIHIYSDNILAVSGDAFYDAVQASVRKYFGEIGMCNIAPKLFRFDRQRASAIIGCHRGRETELQAAVALIQEIGGSSTVALTVKVSGTIKSLMTT